MRSSWNFVPMRYRVDAGVGRRPHRARLRGRRARALPRRPRPGVGASCSPNGCRRCASTRSDGGLSDSGRRQRTATWELMPMLGFDYDSSYPDTDPFEPQSGGCCTWLPYFNRGPGRASDHAAAGPHAVRDPAAGATSGRGSRRPRSPRPRRHGASDHPSRLHARARTGGTCMPASWPPFVDDPTVWQALPRDVSAWWRRRADSTVVAGRLTAGEVRGLPAGRSDRRAVQTRV